MNLEKIIIYDFGSQYVNLIARVIRELGVFSEIVSPEFSVDKIRKDKKIKGIILSGSPKSVWEEDAPKVDKEIFNLGIPILGICYGAQLIAYQNGGEVGRGRREYGLTHIIIKVKSILLEGVEDESQIWMSHSDEILKVPQNFEVKAYTENKVIAEIEHKEKPIYGVQFHPEVYHTKAGYKVFENFLFKICKIKEKWNLKNFLEEKIEELRRIDKKILVALSGGVDSSTLAFLCKKALPEKTYLLFVDTGLLRKEDKPKVLRHFSKFKNFNVINAKNIFLSKLKGIENPEEKRKIIGEIFAEIFEKLAKEKGIEYFAQGTLYPDVIESGKSKGPASVIKTHHNVGGLPHGFSLKLYEPFNLLFKDEVRKIGKMLGVPDEIINSHPFPGPGLAVRIIGEISEDKIKILKEADEILIKNLKKYGIYENIWQAFCVLLPIKTVGIKGDERSYEYVIALRCVESRDGMTAEASEIDWNILKKIASEISNKVKGINRVVYDISSKPPATIEWE